MQVCQNFYNLKTLMELLFWCLDAKIQHIPPLASLIRMLVRHMHKNVKKKKKKTPSLSFTVHTRQLFSHPIFLGNKHLLPIKYKKKSVRFKKAFSLSTNRQKLSLHFHCSLICILLLLLDQSKSVP